MRVLLEREASNFTWRTRVNGIRRGVGQNVTFLFGMVILLLIIVAVLFPALLAPIDPAAKGSFLTEINGVWMAPPYPPSTKYWLGTDIQARDLFSRIIYGARPTLALALLVSVIRIAIGAALGWAAATYPGEIRRYALILSSISATIPSLLFAYLVIVTIGTTKGLPVFILGLSLTGWAPWTQLIYSAIQRIKNEPFMEAAESIGSTTVFKIRNYLIPNMLPVLAPAAAQEIAAALLILAELGFLGIFLGSPRQISLSDLLGGEQPQLPFPEWAGMLAGTRLEIFRWYWLPIMPAVAFFITIFGFNLIADGIRQRLERRERR